VSRAKSRKRDSAQTAEEALTCLLAASSDSGWEALANRSALGLLQDSRLWAGATLSKHSNGGVLITAALQPKQGLELESTADKQLDNRLMNRPSVVCQRANQCPHQIRQTYYRQAENCPNMVFRNVEHKQHIVTPKGWSFTCTRSNQFRSAQQKVRAYRKQYKENTRSGTDNIHIIESQSLDLGH